MGPVTTRCAGRTPGRNTMTVKNPSEVEYSVSSNITGLQVYGSHVTGVVFLCQSAFSEAS